MDKTRSATRTFKSYFKTLFNVAGLEWNYDNDTEIENAVLDIVDAATPEPDTATEQLLQRYRDAAALRIDEIFSLRKERDLAQKALSEACQGQIELAHDVKVLTVERDDAEMVLNEYRAAFDKLSGEKKKAEKERDELSQITLEAVKEMNKACRERDELRNIARRMANVMFESVPDTLRYRTENNTLACLVADVNKILGGAE